MGRNLHHAFMRAAPMFCMVLLAALLLAPSASAQQFSDWSTPVNLNAIMLSDGTPCPAVVNSPSTDQHMTISKDGLSMFFTSDRPGGSGGTDLWVTERDSLDDCWTEPVNLGSVVNSAVNDGAPNLTTDGHWLYFHSKRPGGCGGGTVAELWVTHRQDKRDDFGWETPINLGCTINLTAVDDAGPTFFEDDIGNHFLYFTRNQFPGDTVGFDIYVSICSADLATCNTQGLWGPGARVDALSSPFRDTRTAIRRRDGLEMILSTGRPGSLASENLWVSTRTTTQNQDWSAPVPINCNWLVPMPDCPAGPLVNSPAFDGAPALNWDGTELYFFSERTDLPGFAGKRDLYVSKRTKLAPSGN